MVTVRVAFCVGMGRVCLLFLLDGLYNNGMVWNAGSWKYLNVLFLLA